QGPGAGQFLADQGEFQFAVPVVLYRVAVGLPDAMVPDNHITPAVLPLGDTALEAAIAQRVILDMHRQALVGRVQARSLGHGPADQGPVQLQAEVVVQPPGGVFLDDETQRRAEAALSGRITSWLPGLVEITLAVVFTQGSGHGGLLSVHPDFFLRPLLLWLVDLPPPALPPLPLP